MEVYKLKEDIINKEQETNKLRLECESYKEAISQMEKDMKTLVNNRKKIDDLNYVLSNYIKNEKNGNNNINNPFDPSFTQQQFSYTSSYEFRRPKPERDIDANNYNDYSNKKINTPEWFKTIKKKNLK